MSTSVTSREAIDPLWDPLKETMRTLYIVRDRSLEEVRCEMATKYQFVATKAQYELHFKKWEFRKYRTKDEWRIVGQKISKRKREQKESEVYIDGKLVESKKVKKTTLRYGPTPAAIEMQLQAPSPRTPEGIVIRTPLPTHDSPAPLHSMPAPCTPIPAKIDSAVMDELPFIQFKPMLSVANFRSSDHGTGSTSPLVVPQDLCSSILDQLTKGANGKEPSGCFSQTVKALMPEEVFSNHSTNMQMTASQGHQSSVLDFLSLTMFLVSNNFLGSTTLFVSEKVYEWMKHRSNAALLQYLLSMNGPTVEALAENLFRLAIDADDVRTVKIIMDSDIDEQVYHSPFGLRLTTPLQRACELRSLELVRVLLEAGVDVNGEVRSGDSPLCCAVYSEYERRDIEDDHLEIELVRTLLCAGAKTNADYGSSPLSKAASSSKVEIVALLIAAGADVNFPDVYGTTPLQEAVANELNAPDEHVLAIVRNLLHAGADPQASAVYDYGAVTVLEVATRRGSIELIHLLIDSGARVTESAFVAALSRSDLDILKLFVSSGARVTARVIERAPEDSKPEVILFLLQYAEDSIKDRCSSAALVEAIHHGNMDLIHALDTSGVELENTAMLNVAMAAVSGRGDVRVLRLLLNDNSRYRATVIKSLGSSLHAAIANGRNDITEMLLAAGAAVHSGSGEVEGVKSPLLAAIRRKDKFLARKVLAAGAAVDGTYWNNDPWRDGTWTVLPAAVAWGFHPLIRDILIARADVNIPEREEGKTALTVAVEKGDKMTIRMMIDAGADVNASAAITSGPSALEAAVRNNDVEMVDYLLSIGADSDEGSLVAAVSVNVELMQMLLTARLKRYRGYSTGYGCMALRVAIGMKKPAMIEILLANEIETNTIVRNKQGDIARLLRNSDVQIRYGESALGTAIKTDKSDDLWIVRMLLRGGTNPNSIVELPNFTALLAGINQKNLPLVNALIAAGANVNASLTGGVSRTPLQLAVEKGRMDIVHALLEHGADVNAPPYYSYGATALQFAAIGGYVGIAHLLLERGAEVNASRASVEGRTALEAAAEHGRIDMLQLLLNAGAQIVGSGGEQYEKAKQLASKNGHFAARRLLESYNTQLPEQFPRWDLMAAGVGGLEDIPL